MYKVGTRGSRGHKKPVTPRGLGQIGTRSSSGGSTAGEGKESSYLRSGDEEEEEEEDLFGGSSSRGLYASRNVRPLVSLATNHYGHSSSASSTREHSSSSASAAFPSAAHHYSHSSSASSIPAHSSRLASEALPLVGSVFGGRAASSASTGGAAPVTAAGSGAPVTAAGSGAPVTAAGRTATAGGAAPGPPFTDEQEALLERGFLMVRGVPVQSAVNSESFPDEDLRAFLNRNQTPQQIIRYWQHVAAILGKQMTGGQLSEAAKLNIQNLRQSIQNKISAAEQEAALAASILPPLGAAAGSSGSLLGLPVTGSGGSSLGLPVTGFGGPLSGIATAGSSGLPSATATAGSGGLSSGIATAGPGGLPPAPVGCPCPEIATAIQALSATMGTSGSAAIQAQIAGIEQRLAALQEAAEQRVLAAETANNVAQAEVTRLQGALAAARAATAGSSSSSASSSAADQAAFADLTERFRMQGNEYASAQAAVADLTAQLQQAKAAVKALTAQLQQAQDARTALEQASTTELASRQTTIDELRAGAALAATQHASALTLKDSEIAGLNTTNAALTEQITTMQAATVQSASNANASAAQLRELNAQLMANLTAATTAHTAEKGELEARVAAITALHVQEQAAAAKCNQELATLKSDKEVFLGNMDSAYGKSTFQQILDGYLAVTTELSEAKRGVTNAEARIAELEPENARLTSESGSKTQNIEQLRKELAALKESSDARIEGAETSSQAEAAAKAELRERLTAVEAAKAACDAAAITTAAELATLRGDVANLQEEIAATKQSLETAKQSEAKATQTLNILAGLLPGNDLAGSIQTLKTELNKASTTKADCDAAVAARDAAVKQLREENKKVQDEIAAKAAELAIIQSSLDLEQGKSQGLVSQITAIQEKTAANVASAREKATTAQQNALDELTTQKDAAIDALKIAQSKYEIDIKLKDARIAGLDAQVNSLNSRCGRVMKEVTKIEEHERSRSSSPTPRTGSSSTSASAAAPLTTASAGGGGRGRSTSSATTGSVKGGEHTTSPLYAGGASTSPSGPSSLPNLQRGFGLGGGSGKGGATSSASPSGTTTSTSLEGLSKTNPMHAQSSAAPRSGTTSSTSAIDLTSVTNPMGQRPTPPGGSMSLPPIPLPSVSRPTSATTQVDGLIPNPLYTPTSVSTGGSESKPVAPGGKPVSKPSAGGGGKPSVLSSTAASAPSTDKLTLTNNPYAGKTKLKTKKGRINYKRKTRKNRK